MKDVPVCEKMNLSLIEASKYFGIGINKLREITDKENCDCVLWNGNKRLIKRQKFEEYLNNLCSI